MSYSLWNAVLHGSWGLLGISGYAAIYFLLRGAVMRPVRWLPWKRGNAGAISVRVMKVLAKLMLIRESDNGLDEKSQLLQSSGIQLDAAIYETLRRFLLAASCGIAALGGAELRHPSMLPVEPVYVLAAGAAVTLLLAADSKLLEQFRQRRSQQIVKEIYVISNQLLYFSGSKMNLHHKLMRCTAPTRTIRSAMRKMLAEWYQDAGQAIREFGRRLGTDEARSFAETLQALRLHEHDSYYSLLRERIQDYKEKIELAKESRKETVSYVLFVLAGLPIMNTFRVFMYPWIMEGQKLFQNLN